MAGSRTRVNCLEGSYANRYTTNALLGIENNFMQYVQNINNKKNLLFARVLNKKTDKSYECVYVRI